LAQWRLICAGASAAQLVTGRRTSATLLAKFGSGLMDSAAPPTVAVPGTATRKLTVNQAVEPGGKDPPNQMVSLPNHSAPPDAAVRVDPRGNTRAARTERAVDGPAFVTASAHVAIDWTRTLGGHDSATETSACGDGEPTGADTETENGPVATLPARLLAVTE
jgi:hypothetical protein